MLLSSLRLRNTKIHVILSCRILLIPMGDCSFWEYQYGGRRHQSLSLAITLASTLRDSCVQFFFIAYTVQLAVKPVSLRISSLSMGKIPTSTSVKCLFSLPLTSKHDQVEILLKDRIRSRGKERHWLPHHCFCWRIEVFHAAYNKKCAVHIALSYHKCNDVSGDLQ